MLVPAVDSVGHVSRVDALRPSRLVGTGLLSVKHIGVAMRGHGISGLECARVKLIVVIHEQHILTLRQSETNVSWPAWPAGVLDSFKANVGVAVTDLLQPSPGIVRRAVVDEDDLEVGSQHCLSVQRADQSVKPVTRTVGRDDDADLR